MKKLFRRSLLGFFICIGALLFPASFALADTPVTGNISVNTTWTTSGGVYTIENPISIDSGVTLTIDPGVVVKFRSSTTSLAVNGTLDAQGTTSSIYFTSINDDSVGGTTPGSSGNPQPSDWQFIFINSGGVATLKYADVRYGGAYASYEGNFVNYGGTLNFSLSSSTNSSKYGIYHSSGTTNISTSTFSNNATYGVYGYGSGTISLNGSTFYNNNSVAGYFDLGGVSLTNFGNTASGTGLRGFKVTGTLGVNQTWQADSVPYIVSNVSVPSGKILTINPGAVVKFENSSAQLQVSGELNAEGVLSSTIYFTSINDDVLNDTNGTTTSATAGDWSFILVNSGGTTTLKYADVRYGGAYSNYEGNILTYGGTLNFSFSTSTNSTKYGIYHNGGTTNIATSTFSNNGTYGVYGYGSGTVSLVNSAFSNNTTAAGYFSLTNITLTNSANTASGAGLRGFIVSGTTNADQTWNADTVPYIVSGSGLAISSGKTLTINPGAVVKFESSGSQLQVNGTLDAQGTVNNNIYFTSIKDDILNDTNGTTTSATAGDWSFIIPYTGGTATLKYADVRYGGAYSSYEGNILNYGGTLDFSLSSSTNSLKYGIYHSSGTTNIATSTFSNNATYGVYGYSSGAISLIDSKFSNNATAAGYFDTNLSLTNSGNTATGTGLRGFKVTGTLGVDQTWNADTVPYIVSTVTIPSGKTLTINPNAILKFENSSSQISVNGTLTVQQGPIPDIVNVVYLTSLKDDTIGGDTNADATSTTPSSGDWTFVFVNSGGVATIEHAFVGYGGATYNTNIYNNGGTINISTSTIAHASSYGIRHEGGTTNVKQSVFRNNGSYALYNATSATTTATNNYYWGDVSGPYNALYNPSGTGNAVTNYVSFDPWLGKSHYVHDGYAVSGTQLRWHASTTLEYASEWANAVAKWNELDPINIVEATSTVDLTVEEVDLPLVNWVGEYSGTPFILKLNKAKLSTRAFNQRQNAATHELGHALGLDHSYWENIMYARNTFQTTFGPQDTDDYDYCWVDNSFCP